MNAPNLPGPGAAVGEQVSSQSESQKLNGIRGWLLFFCVALIGVQPLLHFGIIFVGRVTPQLLALALIRSAVSIATGLLILTRSKNLFSWLPWYFGFVAVVNLYLFTAAIERGITPASVVRLLVSTGFYLFVWISYFKTSRRVRATFGRNL